ncbi:MAG: amino acid ABC transporter permease [Acidisphaera sp.]|nr:amino acid ABC transporter permease [Acidisphaera sp.]
MLQSLDWSILWQFRAALWNGLLTTLWISAVGILGSTLAGVAVGCLAAVPSLLLRRLTASYTELLRNLPVIVKLFFLYFVLGVPAIPAALLTLILHQSAYIADVTRAGIRSVPRGQVDAGLSLGHGWWQIYRHILLPQVLRIVIPPMTTQYVSVVKNSAVVALISVEDLTYQTQEINVETFRGFEAATAATVLYIAISAVVIGAMTRLYARLAGP